LRFSPSQRRSIKTVAPAVFEILAGAIFAARIRCCVYAGTKMSVNEATFPNTIVGGNYARFKHEFLELLFAVLVDKRAIFGNDLDCLLVYTAIARLYLKEERGGLFPEDADFGNRRGLTVTKIIQSTRIPRETVRRKLQLLESRGLLEKASGNEWRVAVKDGQPVIRIEFATELQREMRRIVKFVRALKECV
jgi:hypothetical protein